MRCWLLLLMLLVAVNTYAQERGEYLYIEAQEEVLYPNLSGVDPSLFRVHTSSLGDRYSDALRYNHLPVASRRRGLYYSISENIISPSLSSRKMFIEPLAESSVALYGANHRYNLGVRATTSQSLPKGWMLSSNVWVQSGRSQAVEGVFTSYILPEFTLCRRFAEDHFISINAVCNNKMQGLQLSSTQETYSLTGNNLYNPAWGYYNGKVRNSRVRREFAPSVEVDCQLPINDITHLIVEAKAQYQREANSALGWYDATNPMPDYYSKLPSYMPFGAVRDYVTDLWRTSNTQYTQVDWTSLVEYNSISSDGSALYTLEDRVVASSDVELKAIFSSKVSERLLLEYGVRLTSESDRHFKQLRDLLGADYLLDRDIFFGDSYNSSLPLDNNMSTPDRRLGEGERFGYDFSLNSGCVEALLRGEYRVGRFDFEADATLSSEKIWRVGHYQKERFAETSYGESTKILLSPYRLHGVVGYAPLANQYLSLELLTSNIAPSARSLFLNEYSANFLTPNGSRGERISSVALKYYLNRDRLHLSAEAYALTSRGGGYTQFSYDDLLQKMGCAVVSGVGYRSYGAEIVADVEISHSLSCVTTLAVGSYKYDRNPIIDIYDESDLQTASGGSSSLMSGVNIGNAPQGILTSSLTYFGLKRYIFNLEGSYSAGRYAQPSVLRRSERVLSQACLSAESRRKALGQELLPNCFDLGLSASRTIYFGESGRSLIVRLSVRNLLGDRSRKYYAKESDRVILQRSYDEYVGAAMRASSYQYALPRSFTLSLNYRL